MKYRMKNFRCMALCLAGSLMSINSFAGPIAVTSSSQDADGESFTMATGKMKLKVCAPNIIHVMYTPSGTFSSRASIIVSNTFAAPPAFTVASTATAVTVSTAQMKAEVTLATGAIQFLDNAGAVLIAENPDTGKICSVASVDNTGYGVRLAFNLTASEGVYGGGHYDQDNTMNRNTAGHQFRTVAANRDKPIPFIISTNQWGLLWDNYSDTYWNFSGSRTLSIRSTVADQIDYYLVYGQELDSIVAGYRTITGAAPMFPKKVFGFWFSKCQFNNASELTSDASAFRSRNIPIDVIVQDWLWWNLNGGASNNGTWNCMQWDPSRYSDPAGMVNTAHSNNMLVAISVWPTLGASTAIYNDFNGRGWTWPLHYNFGNAYVYDAFRPAAGDLLWNYMNTGVGGTGGVFNKGIDIWWFDGSEPETGNNQGDNQVALYGAITSQSGSNFAGSYYRYCAGYSLAHSNSVYKNQRATSSSKRVCVLTRSVYAGQQRDGTITWTGDAQSTFAQYQREIAQGCNFCAAGVPYWTTDVGAFYAWTGPTGEGGELFTRWFQFSTFLPIMRVHGQNSGSSGREMWNFTGSYYNSQIKFDSLRYRLMPYMYSNAWKVTNDGYTIMRVLPFDFRTDANARNQITEFMFGPAFLVAPITTSGATSRSVYLPAGATWYDFWSGATSTGGTSPTVNADIMSMPLFVRGGSIVPMGPNIQYANQKQPDTIELRVYPGANGSYTLYEDEGDNYNYETGARALIPITYVDNPKNLIIGARSGSFTGMLQSRVFKVVYVGSSHGTGIATTSNPDCTLTYSGSQVSCTPVGTLVQNEAPPIRPRSITLKTAGNLILGSEFAGKTKVVAFYDLGGKLVVEKTLRANTINLRKAGVPGGVYIVKVKTVP